MSKKPPTQQQKFVEGARVRLEDAAMKYARMKTLGRYFDGNDGDVQLCAADRPDHEKYMLLALQQAAVDLFAEIAATPLPPRVKP